jgi:hypothetical protein
MTRKKHPPPQYARPRSIGTAANIPAKPPMFPLDIIDALKQIVTEADRECRAELT